MTSPSDDWRFDRDHVWHPYTALPAAVPVFPVHSASGVRLKLADGRELIDGMASWWSAIHGYNHPVLNQAIKAQTDQLAHVMFGGLTQRPAVRLAQQLVQITPDGLECVFFSDSGSVAVEVAIKMAVQYQHAAGFRGRHKLLTIRNGYHGDTFAAMSVCDPVTGMHGLFQGALMQQFFADAPRIKPGGAWDASDIESMRILLEKNQDEIAAVILEPVVQGAGGMRFYHPDYLAATRTLCDEYGVLLIADEIATGFGRSGELFACNHAGITPDILCLGKALTGGYMTLAATLCTNRVATTISTGEAGVFMHGPTFMGNPLACAVASASIDLLLEQDWQGNIHRIEAALQDQLQVCASLAGVIDVRVMGAIGVVELQEPADMGRIQPAFVEAGIWVRPFGKLVYVMPPYIINDEELAHLTRGIYNVLAQYLASS